MSYFKHHVFFCCNQRAAGESCCNDHKASELQTYAKERTAALGLKGKGSVRVNTAGCLGRCDDGPVLVTGATGGVGSIATMLLASAGFDVAALTGRPDELGDYLRELGAVPVPCQVEVHQGAHVGRPGLLTVDIPASGGIVVSGTAIPIP